MIINLTSKQRRTAAFVAGVCTSLVLAFVFAQIAQAQVVDFVSFQLEKKLSDPYPTGLEADQFTFDVIGTTASGTPVSFSDIPLTEFTADSANGSVNLQAGTYTITENGPVDFIPGEWTVQWSGAGCDNQSGDSTTITIDVDDLGKENFGCRADNQWRHGNLRVVKDVVGTTTAPENFEFTVTQGNTVRFDGPFNAQGDMEVVIAMGDYEVVEDIYAGYTTTYSSSCVGTIAQGGSETCTITNTWSGQPAYSQSGYYSQGSYDGGYSQGSYYTQGSYDPGYSQSSYYSQGSYDGGYSQGSYSGGGYSQGSYGGGNGRKVELRDGGGDNDDDDDDTSGAPAPQVLGESTDIPLGAPGTGHGGASRSASDLQALAILSFRRGVKASHAA